MQWWRDRALLKILAIDAVLRATPLLLWPDERCVRDECTYMKVADRLLGGEGITGSAGWLWAPGYPALLALHKAIFGYATALKITQIPVSMGVAVLLYLLCQRALSGWAPERARRAGLLAAALYALSPTQIFFATRVWSEVVYTAALLGGLLLLNAARDGLDHGRPARRTVDRAALAGALIGVCVLFRGIATYMVPVMVAALLWRAWRAPRVWLHALVLVVGVGAAVGPYSLYATRRFDALVISDRTLGQMMWLGNNEFPPISFDYGNGQLGLGAFDRTTAKGRDHCAPQDDVIGRDTCETAQGIAWIKGHPKEFLARVPLRLAQLLTPHSLLTRHLRWGLWRGMPQVGDELIVLFGAAMTLVTVLGGALGLAAWSRRSLGVAIVGLLAYHFAAIAVTAGLSRYRVPLEPLLMVFAAAALLSPRQTWAALRAEPWRGAAAVLALAVLTPLMLWFLPAGWVWWRSW